MKRTRIVRKTPLRRFTPLRARKTVRLPGKRPPKRSSTLDGWRLVRLRCANCDAVFHRPACLVRPGRPAFCGRRCGRQYRRGERHPQYRGGPAPPLPPDWEERAERIRARDGYRCRNCGKTQRENGRKLSVDHVDPRRWLSSGQDVADEDLMSRCSVCHGKKTAGAERKLLRGDALAFRQYLARNSSPAPILGVRQPGLPVIGTGPGAASGETER